MTDLGQTLIERLREVFGNDSQDLIAQNLGMTQGNVSKMLNGAQYPALDTLVRVSEIYNVSVDWLLGLSDRKGRNSVNYDTLTYEQLVRIIDVLYSQGTIVVGDGKKKTNTDNIHIVDGLLSYLVRKCNKVKAVDDDTFDSWKNDQLSQFSDIRVIKCTKEALKEMGEWGIAKFNYGDWITHINALLDNKIDEESGGKDGRD